MFQSFEASTTPSQGPARLEKLRSEMQATGIVAFLVPRADAHQGEYVAACDERLAWLTGFTGSAGFAAILMDEAGVFVDGRYRLQLQAQVDTNHFTPVNWPETKLADWLSQRLGDGGEVGFDPWLHTRAEVETMENAGLSLKAVENLVDRIWIDRPSPPAGEAFPYPIDFAGVSAAEKRERIGTELRQQGQSAAILTLPDSICWLLNIRGRDLPRIPIIQGFAILHSSGNVELFTDPQKAAGLGKHLDADVKVRAQDDFLSEIASLEGPVRVDRQSAPHIVAETLERNQIPVSWEPDPCILAKAAKTDSEIAATREAHIRDGAAMVEFLAWLDLHSPSGTLTEIDVVERLEECRRSTGALVDISFDTIAGAGPNGAIVHYRVTRETNRTIEPGDLLLIDSGGQYLDGTTDVTRTIIAGKPNEGQTAAFTCVLQGMIAISRARFPEGLSGRDLDPLARAPLWMAGQDFDHGTGHGVGVFLSVHEGPQRISRTSDVALRPGMILSNEPGYYREGEWGIRIENLVAVRKADRIADDRNQLCFETLTWVPIDKRLIAEDQLSPGERTWLNEYHNAVFAKLAGRVSDQAKSWLKQATRAI